MKANRLLGMPVVSIDGAQKVGRIHDLVVNPGAGRILAVRIKLEPAGIVKTVSATDVSVGRDAATLREGRSVPEEELTEMEGTLDLSKLRRTKVLTHGGDLLGRVEDVEFDPEGFRITEYQVGGGPVVDLFLGSKTVVAGEGIRYGRDLLVVPDGLVERPRRAA